MFDRSLSGHQSGNLITEHERPLLLLRDEKMKNIRDGRRNKIDVVSVILQPHVNIMNVINARCRLTVQAKEVALDEPTLSYLYPKAIARKSFDSTGSDVPKCPL